MKPNQDFVQDFFENFDLKFFLYVARKSFIFIAILFLISLIVPYLYLRYTTPIFEATATLIKKKEVTNTLLDGANTELLKTNEEDKINRDIQVIKSDFLFDKLIDSLNINVQYFRKGRMFYKRFELNAGDFFTIENDYKIFNKSLYNAEIEIEFHDKQVFDLSYKLPNKKVKSKSLKVNKTYRNEDIEFKILAPSKPLEGSYVIVFNSKENIKRYLSSQIQVLNSGPNILFSIKSTNPTKSVYILNHLIAIFLNLDKKENAERLENSIQYIKSYLDTLDEQAKYTQGEKMDYVKRNGVYDPSAQLSNSLTEIETYKKAIDELELRLIMLARIKREVQSHSSHSMESLTLENEKDILPLIKERNKLLIDYKPSHPTIQILDKQIQDRVAAAQRSISIQMEESNEQLKSFISKRNKAVSDVTNLPEKTMELSKIQKELDIKEKYVFDLIEKQIQYLILKSSIGADYLLIQPPTAKDEQIYPRRGLAYIAGFIVFLFLSLGILFLRYIRFGKVVSIDEIKRKTHVPILGFIPFVPEAIDHETLNSSSPESRIIVLDSFKSQVSEVFKKMRASLKYTSAGDYKTICSTSTIPGEGKTFILINLAAVHALLDKRVLIIDLDLRKPRISKSFKLSNKIGMSSLLSDKNLSIHDCIQKQVILENLDVITSGPIPPNPSELITSQRYEEVLEELKKHYDYIFIDTPPIGLVNESIEIVNKSDISLYLVKINFSDKEFYQVLNETDRLKKNSNLFLIVNHYGEGASGYINSKFGYGYGHGYGKKYKQYDGYYTKESEPKINKSITRFLNYLNWKL